MASPPASPPPARSDALHAATENKLKRTREVVVDGGAQEKRAWCTADLNALWQKKARLRSEAEELRRQAKEKERMLDEIDGMIVGDRRLAPPAAASSAAAA